MANRRSPQKPEQDALDSLQRGLEALEAILPSFGPAVSNRVRPQIEEAASNLLRLRAAMPKAPHAIMAFMAELLNLLSVGAEGLKTKAVSEVRGKLAEIGADLVKTVESLDPIRTPSSVFDPTAPKTAGRLVAIALLSQQRLPLEKVGQMYGSGCYALYYTGEHPAYRLISGTETPIYVGKADPLNNEAETPQEQGARLTGRLCDHRRMIMKAEKWATENPSRENHPIKINEFEYRRIVVASNAQLVAEQYLIAFFKPIWNKECKVCWGISKHGDAASTRGNSRSPWDVLHPGRAWAQDDSLKNSKEREVILELIEGHFTDNPPYDHLRDILDRFMQEFNQAPVEVGGIDAPEELDE